MTWILIATSGVFVLSNVPLILTLTRFQGSTFAFFWKFSPHQFFFSLVCVPVAAFLTCCALWWALRAIGKAAIAAPEPWSFVSANWPAVFLGAICLASLVALSFFLGTTWSPDKLSEPYASDSVVVVSEIGDDYEAAGTAKRLAALDSQKAAAAKSVKASGLTLSNLTSKYPALKPFEKAQILLSKDGQNQFGVADGVATALSAFQIMVVVGVAAVLLLTCTFILWLGWTGVAPPADMVKARTSIFCAICCFVPYPYLFGLYRSELERVVKVSNTGAQEYIALIFIVIALAAVVASDPNATIASVESVRVAVAGIVAVFGIVSTRIDGIGILRQLIGLESSIGAQVGLVLSALLLTGIAVTVSIPRP